MRRRIFATAAAMLLCCLPGLLWAQARLSEPHPPEPPPQVLYGDLFTAVQMQSVFADSKAFADADARAAPKDILAQYHRAKPESVAALKAFVDGDRKSVV